MKTIAIAGKNGLRRMQCVPCGNHFAVHRSVARRGYTLTHVQTGYAVAQGYPSEADAIASGEKIEPLTSWKIADPQNLPRRFTKKLIRQIRAIVEAHGGATKGTDEDGSLP